jgi:hypothetical protein
MDGVGDRSAERAQRGQSLFTVFQAAGPHDEHPQDDVAHPVGGNIRRRRGMHDLGNDGQVFRRGDDIVEIGAHDLAGCRQHDVATEHRADAGELEGELGDHAEVATTAPDCPEEALMRLVRRGDDAAIGQHNLGRDEVVDCEAVLADHEADAAAGGEPTDADRGGIAGGQRQPVRACRRDDIGRRGPGLDFGDARRGIDRNALEVREVDDHRIVDDAVVGETVTAAADREGKADLAGEVDGGGHVVRRGDLDDGIGEAVGRHRDDLAGRIVVGMTGGENFAGDPLAQQIDRLGDNGQTISSTRFQIHLVLPLRSKRGDLHSHSRRMRSPFHPTVR